MKQLESGKACARQAAKKQKTLFTGVHKRSQSGCFHHTDGLSTSRDIEDVGGYEHSMAKNSRDSGREKRQSGIKCQERTQDLTT